MGENYAFIDSQNLNLSILSLGWKLDFQRFRVYLRDKYHVQSPQVVAAAFHLTGTGFRQVS